MSPVLDRFLFNIFFGVLVSTKLFVGSLPWAISDQQLKETFEAHGNVVSAKVVTDRATGRSRGFGFVEMENAEDAQKAMKALNDSELGGRNIVVNEAKSKN
jgi:RNA recognition motif-containing protein